VRFEFGLAGQFDGAIWTDDQLHLRSFSQEPAPKEQSPPGFVLPNGSVKTVGVDGSDANQKISLATDQLLECRTNVVGGPER
jgi:hypothetical protein